MAALSKRKTKLRFETDNLLRGRNIMVEVEPLICTLRLKGKRARYSINWETVFCAAAEIAARKLREERKKKREERKKNKRSAV
jgi:hypothetical protein